MIWFQSICRKSLSVLLLVTLGLSLSSDAHAQQSSISWQSRLNNIWSRIIKDDEDKEPPWGSRGDICVVAPAILGPETQLVWHDQPVIVWTVSPRVSNTVPKFVVRNTQTGEQIWEYVSSVGETSVVYDGEPLQSGQIYELEVYKNADAEMRLIFPRFQVLPSLIRRLVSNGLENSFKNNESSVADAEWVALHQAEYFADRNLPFDAIQALFSVSDPSPELVAVQEQVIAETCD